MLAVKRGMVMKVAVFHGSPRKGNTYQATKFFCDVLSACGDVQFTEFFLPAAVPKFCTGCQLCFSHANDKCPHAEYVAPVLEAILAADALIFATPHHGVSAMSSGMKNMLDHLDFLTFVVAPRKELFSKKAFVITTGTGSVAAIKPIEKGLRNWGVNRVYTMGLRMFIDKWDRLAPTKQARFEKKLQRAARKFYRARKGVPYISTILMFYMSKMIMKKYVGQGAYPYEHWRENGYFTKRPF